MPSSSRRKRFSLFGKKKVDTRKRRRISRDSRPLSLLSSRRYLYLCLAFLAARLLFARVMHNPAPTLDYEIGVNLAEGHGFAANGVGDGTLRPPLYPLFLAFCHWCYSFEEYAPGSDQKIAILIQQFLAGLVPLWLARLGERWDSPRPGQIVGMAFLLSPSYFLYPCLLESTNLLVPLSVAFLLQLTHLDRVKRRTVGELILVGAMAGLLILLQPLMLAPLLGVAVWWLYRTRVRADGWLMPVAMLACVLPWTVRNFVVFHQIIPFQATGWRSVYRGFLDSEGKLAPPGLLPAAQQAQLAALEKTKSDVATAPYYREAAGHLLSAHPGVYLQKSLERAMGYWGTLSRDPSADAVFLRPVRRVSVPLWNLASLLGAWLLWRRRRYLAMAVVAVLVYFTLVYAFTQIESVRAKLDVEWLQCFLIAGLAEALLLYRDRLTKKNRASAQSSRGIARTTATASALAERENEADPEDKTDDRKDKSSDDRKDKAGEEES